MRLIIALCCLAFASLSASERPQATIETSMGTITVELFADQTPETVAHFLGLANGTKSWTDPRSGTSSQAPFYDGLTFHRVIDNFMLQGGCPLGTGTGGPGYRFADEINASSLGLDQEQAVHNGQPNQVCMQDLQQLIMPTLQKKGLLVPGADRNQLMQAFLMELQAYQGWSLKRLYEERGYRYRADLPASSKPLRGFLAMANSGPGTNGSQFFINLVDTPHLTGKHTVFGRVIAGMDVVDAIGKVPTGEANRPTTPVVIERIRSVE